MAKRKNPHAVALGRKGGSVSSDAKTKAVRRNAKKGGRKPKFENGDRVVGRQSGPASLRERTGVVVDRPAQAEYVIRFDDGATEVVYSWWIEKG